MSLVNYLNYVYETNRPIPRKKCPLLESIQPLKLYLLQILVLTSLVDKTILTDVFEHPKMSKDVFSKCMIDYDSGTPFDSFIGKSGDLYKHLTSDTLEDLQYTICEHLPISTETGKIDFDVIQQHIMNINAPRLVDTIKRCLSGAIDNVNTLLNGSCPAQPSSNVIDDTTRENLIKDVVCSMTNLYRISQIINCPK